MEHDDLVVADQRYEPALLFEFDQSVHHAATVRAAIDVVAQRDQQVVRGGLHDVQQGVEGLGAAMDITDRYRTRRRQFETLAAQGARPTAVDKNRIL